MNESPVTILLILANLLVTYKGLRDASFMDRYTFNIEAILVRKDYIRLISSGFLHGSWTHLLFNMMTLYFFGPMLEMQLGTANFIMVYVLSLLGGDVFSLFLHRYQSDYTSLGASGAVMGLIFSCIALFPGMQIGFFGIPIPIPAWAYGLFYVLLSIYGIRSQKDHIGHDAHLGGGLTGLLTSVCLFPAVLISNYLPILLIVIPSVVFIYLILTRPQFLVTGKFSRPEGLLNKEDRYNERQKAREDELNTLLDKISRKGIDSLSKKERERLNELGK
jgi:membrane associated rhomboid family serine protease